MMRAFVLMAVFAALAVPAHAATGACVPAPVNGDILDGDDQFRLAADPLNRTEGHTVEISNAARRDAIVKIRAAGTRRLVVSFLVRGSETARVSGLADGDYTLQYAVGDVLARDCKSFAHARAIGQFRGTEHLITRASGYTIETRYLRYTLFGGGGGAVHPVAIDLATFNAP